MPMMLPDTPGGVEHHPRACAGPNMAVATACASGNNAIGEAARIVQRGEADAMLPGQRVLYRTPGLASFIVMGASRLTMATPNAPRAL